MLGRIWQQSHGPGAFDGCGQLALMPGAGAGFLPAANGAIFHHKTFQGVNCFPINIFDLVHTKGAHLSPGDETAPAARTVAFLSVLVIIISRAHSLLFPLISIFGPETRFLAACRRKTSEVFGVVFVSIVTFIIWLIWRRNHVPKLPKSGKTGFSDRLLAVF